LSQSNARVAHIGLAVTSIDEAVRFYRDVLGVTPRTLESVDGASIVSLHLGDVEIELLEPTNSEGPVARFIAKRGPGIHHICIRVPDLNKAVLQCHQLGYRLVDQEPRLGAHGRRISFVHPKSTSGILLELTE